MTAHTWHRARFTGATTCERCGLLPVDPDDYDTECPNPLGIHCRDCTTADPCTACADQIAAEHAYQTGEQTP